MSELMERLAQVPGHTKPAAGRELYRLASRVSPDLAIVEIGVFKGRSVCYLGAGARAGRGAHVWGIDPWDLPGERYPFHWKEERPSRHAFTKPETREIAERSVAELDLSDQVTLIREFSYEAGLAWSGPRIGLLYIDGDHRADAIRRDGEAWFRHLEPGAVVAFDDHVPTCPDVVTVVAEMVEAGWLSAPVKPTRRLAVTEFL